MYTYRCVLDALNAFDEARRNMQDTWPKELMSEQGPKRQVRLGQDTEAFMLQRGEFAVRSGHAQERDLRPEHEFTTLRVALMHSPLLSPQTTCKL